MMSLRRRIMMENSIRKTYIFRNGHYEFAEGYCKIDENGNLYITQTINKGSTSSYSTKSKISLKKYKKIKCTAKVNGFFRIGVSTMSSNGGLIYTKDYTAYKQTSFISNEDISICLDVSHLEDELFFHVSAFVPSSYGKSYACDIRIKEVWLE